MTETLHFRSFEESDKWRKSETGREGRRMCGDGCKADDWKTLYTIGFFMRLKFRSQLAIDQVFSKWEGERNGEAYSPSTIIFSQRVMALPDLINILDRTSIIISNKNNSWMITILAPHKKTPIIPINPLQKEHQSHRYCNYGISSPAQGWMPTAISPSPAKIYNNTRKSSTITSSISSLKRYASTSLMARRVPRWWGTARQMRSKGQGTQKAGIIAARRKNFQSIRHTQSRWK